MAGQDADQNSLVKQQLQQLNSEIKDNAVLIEKNIDKIEKTFELQESAKSKEDKANATERLQYYRARDDKLVAERDKLLAQRDKLLAQLGTGGRLAGSSTAGAAGDTVALGEILAEIKEVKEKLQPMHDDVKSWHSSHALEASKVSSDKIYLLRRLLQVTFVPEGNVDVQTVLSEGADDNDFEWDNTPEPAQRGRYMNHILSNLGQVYTSRSISWKQQITAKLVVKGLGHQVVARSDELICARRFHNDPAAGAVVGVELKKKLSYASRRQGEAEFYTFSLTSNFPFVQVVTDMQQGGFAYWKEGVQDRQQVVKEKVLVGMSAVYEFLTLSIGNLPWNLGQDEDAHIVMPPQLDQPSRCKLVDPLVHALHPLQVAVEKGDEGNDALDDLLPWYTRDQLHIWDCRPACLHDGTLSYFS